MTAAQILEREAKIKAEQELERQNRATVRRVFDLVDSDQSETVGKEEVMEAMKKPALV